MPFAASAKKKKNLFRVRIVILEKICYTASMYIRKGIFMNKFGKSVLAMLLALVLFCSPLTGILEAHAFDPSKDIYLDGTQDFLMAADVVRIMNEERAKNGLSALTMDPVLMDYAMQRAAEVYVYFSHTRPNDSECFSIFGSAYTYGTKGENIAIGQDSAAEVMDAWMNSEGHRANILNGEFNSVGIGCFYQPDGSIGWVQLFYSGKCKDTETRKNVQKVTDVEISIKVSKMVGRVEHHTFSNAFCAAYLYEGSTVGTDFYLINRLYTYQKIRIKTDNVKYSTSNSDVFTVNNDDHTITATGVGKARLSVIYGGWEISVMDDAGYINNNADVEVLEKPALTYSFDDRGNILVDYSAFNSSLNLYYKGNKDDMWTMANWESDMVYTHYYPDPTETYVYVMRYYDSYLDENVEIGDRLVIKLGDEDPNPDPGPGTDPDPDPNPDIGVDLPDIPDRDQEPTIQEALQLLKQMKEACPAGTAWTLDSYTWLGGALDVLGGKSTDYEDMAFCMALSDRVFGDLPAKEVFDVKLDDLRPGDILMDSYLGNMIIMDMAQNYIYCATVVDGTVRYHLLSPANYSGYVTCALVRYESQAPGAATINPSPVPENANIVASGNANYERTYMGETTYYAILWWELDDEGTMYFYGMGDLKRTSHSTWASYYDQIKRVVFGPNIGEIDTSAFERFKQLEEVVLGQDMEVISAYAFNGCTALRKVTFPEGLTEISNYSFYDCDLQELNLPASLKIIGEDAFGENAFEVVRLPDGLVTLGEGAFSNNDNLVSVYIPASLEEMGDYAFSSCKALSQVELAEGITVLGDYAFSHCESITTMTLPGSLTRIPEGLFKFAGLQTVYFEKGVQVIGDSAFYQCRNLTAFYAYNTLTTIEDYAFDGCEQLWNVYFYGTYEQWLEVEIGANMWMLEMFATINCLDPDACTHENVTVIPKKAPTCTENGHSEGQVCADCGEILKKQKELPALGHDWGEWEEIVPPTEDSEGLRQHTCQRCAEAEQEPIPPISTAERGDVNGDGRVSVSDARAILRYIADLTEEGEVDEDAADFNGDGKVNVRDARAILRHIAGMD